VQWCDGAMEACSSVALDWRGVKKWSEAGMTEHRRARVDFETEKEDEYDQRNTPQECPSCLCVGRVGSGCRVSASLISVPGQLRFPRGPRRLFRIAEN